MKIITLQDVIIEGSYINIVQSGSSIMIEGFPGFRAVAKTVGQTIMNPKMLTNQAVMNIRELINSYYYSLPGPKRQALRGKIKIQDNLKNKDDDSDYTTIVKAPEVFLTNLQKYIGDKYENNISPSYHFDIDDLAVLGSKAPEDTKGEMAIMTIWHITEKDYAEASNKNKTEVSKEASSSADTEIDGEAVDANYQREFASK